MGYFLFRKISLFHNQKIYIPLNHILKCKVKTKKVNKMDEKTEREVIKEICEIEGDIRDFELKVAKRLTEVRFKLQGMN